jgi:hypothetical protein
VKERRKEKKNNADYKKETNYGLQSQYRHGSKMKKEEKRGEDRTRAARSERENATTSATASCMKTHELIRLINSRRRNCKIKLCIAKKKS